MIITKIGCCLRPLGIVLNEQSHHDGLLLTSNLSIKHILCFHYDICSFIMNPYGRVQTFGCKKGRADSAALPFKVALLFLTRGQGLF